MYLEAVTFEEKAVTFEEKAVTFDNKAVFLDNMLSVDIDDKCIDVDIDFY